MLAEQRSLLPIVCSLVARQRVVCHDYRERLCLSEAVLATAAGKHPRLGADSIRRAWTLPLEERLLLRVVRAFLGV